MKLLLPLLCFAGFVAASEWHWPSGKEIVFEYSGRLLTGLPEMKSNHFSGIGITCDVVLQVKSTSDIRLTLRDVKFSRVNGVLETGSGGEEGSNWRNLRLPGMTALSGDLESVLSMPVVFSLRKSGELDSVTVSHNDPEWSINFKKALCIIFQTKLSDSSRHVQENNVIREDTESETYWTTMEETMDGRCEHMYQVNELPEYIIKEESTMIPLPEACRERKFYEVIKTKDVNSCEKRASFTFHKPGFFSCPGGNCDGMWSRSSSTRYIACGSRGNLVLQKVINEGELTQNLLGVRTEKYVTGSKQVLTLKKIESISSPLPEPSEPVTLNSWMFDFKRYVSGDIENEHKMTSRLPQSLLQEPTYGRLLPRNFLPEKSGQEVNQKLSKEEIITSIKTVLKKLIKDVHEVEDVPEKQIGMKVMSISRSLSMLSKEDISELYQEMKSSGEDHSTLRNMYFDIVLLTGTNSCVSFIKEMILKKEMPTSQAITTLMFLPHYVLTPTSELLHELFELVTSSHMMENKFMYNNAIIGFSNLVQKACLDDSRKSIYPTYVFGEFCNPDSEIVTSKWIPYLSTHLKEAKSAEEKNVYIITLGMLSHRSVIPILLPYIERTHEETTDMTRYLAVFSIETAGLKVPSQVIPVIFSIFNNPAESTEIRIAALQVLLNLDAPEAVLQKIVASTWGERDQEVLKSVYTAFYTLSKQAELDPLKRTTTSLSRKAWSLLPLMKKVGGKFPTSGIVYNSDYMKKLGVGFHGVTSWISDKSSFIPSNVYTRIEYVMDRLHVQPLEFAMKFRGSETLYQQIARLLAPLPERMSQDEAENEHVEKIKEELHGEWRKIIEKLQIKARKSSPMEWAVYGNFFDDITFFKSTGDLTEKFMREKIMTLLENRHQLKEKLCGNSKLNYQRVIDVAPNEFLIPSELGFPIIIEVHMPVVFSIKGDMNVDCNTATPRLGMNIRTLFTSQFSGLVGTYCPFTKEMVVTGIEESWMTNLPADLSITVNIPEGSVDFVIKPISVSKPIDLLHFHTKPFTVCKNLYDLSPITLNSEVKYIHSDEPSKKVEMTFGETLGLSLKSIVETESRYTDMQSIMQVLEMYNYNPLNMIRFGWTTPAISETGTPSFRKHEYKLQYDPISSNTKEIVMKWKWGYASKAAKQEEPKYYILAVQPTTKLSERDDEYKLEKLVPYGIESQKLNAESGRHPNRKQLLQKAFEKLGEIQSGEGYALDFSTVLKGSRPRTFNYHLVFGKGRSHMNTSWSAKFGSGTDSGVSNICVDGSARYPSVPLWNLDMIRSSDITYEYENKIGFGRTCDESKINIHGSSQVSQQQKEASKISDEAQKCKKNVDNQQRGAWSSEACKIVRKEAKMIDEVDFKIEYINTPSYLSMYEKVSTDFLKAYLWPYLKLTDNSHSIQSNEDRTVTCRIMFHNKYNTFDLSIRKPNENIRFVNVRLPYPLDVMFPVVAGESSIVRAAEALTGNSLFPSCRMEGKWVKTFDNSSKPMELDDCFHLITGDCSKYHSFGVLARSLSHSSKSKEVKVFLGKREIKLVPSSSHSEYNREVKVFIDGEELKVEQSSTKTIHSGKETVGEIYRSPDNVLRLKSFDSNKMELYFDGEKIRITSSQLLKNKLCGLCGDFNHQKIADARGPRGCIFSKPELEVASYRIPSASCSSLDKSIQEELKKEQEHCDQYKELPTKITRSFKVQSGECSRHEHVIMERSEQICFSRVPITRCGLACTARPSTLVKKRISFTCLPANRVAEHYQDKVLAGLELPELKSKPESFSTTINLPQSCVSVL